MLWNRHFDDIDLISSLYSLSCN